MSLNHQTLKEFQLRSAGKDYRIEMYDHAIDLFLTEFPEFLAQLENIHIMLTGTITAKNKM